MALKCFTFGKKRSDFFFTCLFASGRIMARITMQVLTPQDASGSNQCHIKEPERASLIHQAGRRRSAVTTGKDYFEFQLTAAAAAAATTVPVNVGHTMHWRRKRVWPLILMSAVLRDRLKMIRVKCFPMQT